ncbi:MAG: hypothetical protein Q8916_14585 [Bacteroidota bacterium]|nr:hypothetical protein [Bacteroidota bacterium]MDP4236461.1 hypothetical protein [Bacteroidota bacterium]
MDSIQTHTPGAIYSVRDIIQILVKLRNDILAEELLVGRKISEGLLVIIDSLEAILHHVCK